MLRRGRECGDAAMMLVRFRRASATTVADRALDPEHAGRATSDGVREIVKKLVDEIAPTYKDRKGGFTRVLRAGFRLGDQSPIAIFELV